MDKAIAIVTHDICISPREDDTVGQVSLSRFFFSNERAERSKKRGTEGETLAELSIVEPTRLAKKSPRAQERFIFRIS